MRIAGSQIQQIVGTYLKGTRKADAPENAPAAADEVTLSGRATDVAKARQAYDALPDVRAGVVAEVKARIASGAFDPSDEQIADAIGGPRPPG